MIHPCHVWQLAQMKSLQEIFKDDDNQTNPNTDLNLNQGTAPEDCMEEGINYTGI